MSRKKEEAFARGRVQGILESGWTCADCGNLYDATVDSCPNRLLDEAQVARLSQQVGRDDLPAAGKGLHSQAPFAPDGGAHFPECRCFQGSCCPWVGECTCQCLCDVFALVELRVRAEYAASERGAGCSEGGLA